MNLSMGDTVFTVSSLTARTVSVRQARVIAVNCPLTMVCVTDGGYTWFVNVSDVFATVEEARVRKKQLEDVA